MIQSHKKAGIPNESTVLPIIIIVISNAKTPYCVGVRIFVETKIYKKVKIAPNPLNIKNDKNLNIFN